MLGRKNPLTFLLGPLLPAPNCLQQMRKKPSFHHQLDDTSLADLTAWHRHYNTAGDGYMTMDEWLAALNAADVEKTLRSRGVDASTLSGGSGKDMELIHRVAGSFNAVFRVRNSFPLQNTCYADPSPGRSQVHVCCEPADDH